MFSIQQNRTELDKVNWKHGHTKPVMCNRKIGVWKQTGAFVSNRNKKRQQHAQNDSTKQKPTNLIAKPVEDRMRSERRAINSIRANSILSVSQYSIRCGFI